MRIALALFGGLAVSMAALVYTATPPRDAYACSFGPPMLDLLIEGSGTIVLVDITDVGGPTNTQPTVTPRAKDTPTATPSPTTPTSTPEIVYDSPTPWPTATPFDLTGYGATGVVVKTYKGVAQSPLVIDTKARIELERRVREAETWPPGSMPSCPFALGHMKYAVGQRYVLLGRESGDHLETEGYAWWAVRTDEHGELYVPLPGNLYVRPATYEAYLQGYGERLDDGWYVVRADRMPFDTFERIITGAPPAAPPIVPPTTGSAGLKR